MPVPEEIDGYTGQRMICDGIVNGDCFWHVCHFGRVYNNVTGLEEVVEAVFTWLIITHLLVVMLVTPSLCLLVYFVVS